MSGAATPTGLSDPGSRSGLTREPSDGSLALRAVDGDERAFAAIFDRHHQSLYRYCLALVGNPQDAQDALQNTMIKVLRALPGEERHIELKAWLFRIAHNESIELLRRCRETRPLDHDLAAAGSGLAEAAAVRERLRVLISDLGRLPERQRGALVMRELAGLDFAEIGAALGASPAAARQTLYEARLSLRRMDEGREMSCEKVTEALSDGDGRVARRRDIRTHLHACASCRRFGEEIKRRERDFASFAPLPAAAAAGLLQGLLGGHAASSGGLASAVGGGAAKSFGASAALKGAAAAAVVAAIGVGAADRGGLVDVGLPDGGRAQAIVARQPAASAPVRPRLARSDPAAARPTAGSIAGAEGAGRLGASRAPKPAESASPVDAAAPGETGGPGESAGAGEAAKPAAGQPATYADPEPDPEPTTPPAASQDDPAPPAHGKGHEKQLPSASAHGQETAASHKPEDPGPAAGAPGHPAHPEKPAHPAQASNPSPEEAAAPPAPASPVAPEANGNGKGKGNGKAAGPPPIAEEGPPGHETGKKP
jgi:RNA polymerase sigma factor (sigma-70 family)